LKGGNNVVKESHSGYWLYDLYFYDVYQYLLYFTNSQEEAEELTQETFFRVLKNTHQFEQRSQMKTWIFSIARNVAIDHNRKLRRVSLFSDFYFLRDKSNLGNPEHEVEMKEEWVSLQTALLKLKPQYRNVVILRGLKEFSIKETAEILNISESKVKVDYHRAIKLLKDQFH
jgi:RNA polymerase sigma-70 factor, ECF subfamily